MPGLSRRFVAGFAALFLVLMWLPAALVTSAAASGVDAGFEIDGNKVVNGNLDWSSSSVGTQPVENDDAGGDPTVYSSSSKESNDPSTWTLAGGAPPKDDMTNIYAYAKPGTADVFFGFDRGATSGTDSYYLELNKLQPTNTTTYAPNRSDGDLRFRLDDKGNGVIALSAESVWTGGAWVTTTLASNPAGFDYAVSADESFLEFSFDLTTLLNLHPDCPPLFGSLGFRNVTGATGENLKDFIKPVKLSAGSTCVPEIRVVKSSDPASGTAADPAPVSPGDDVTYTLTVHNDGLADAFDVPVSDVVPDGTEYVDGSADATGGTFDSGTNTVSWSVSVPFSDSVDVSFKVHVVDTDANGTLVDNTATFANTHTSTDDCIDPAAGLCHTNTTHHEVEFATLALAKTADPASGSIVQRGDSIDYTITVSNSGLAAAQGVSVVDTLPDGVTLDESSVSPAEQSNSNGQLTWLVDVPAAQNGVDGVTTITYTVTVDADAPEGATLTNAVLIGGECPGAPEGTDPCTTDHHVPTGALTLVKHVDQTSAEYGDTLTYTFDAAATGDLDQTAVVVTDVVPDGTTYVSGSAGCTDAGPCTTGYDAADRTVSWELGDIAHGSTPRKLVFKVTIDKPVFDPAVGHPGATVTNSGLIVSGETAETPSNKVETVIIQVLGVKVVRNPPTLPFTGSGLPLPTAGAVASLLIAAGAMMASLRRRED